ncbi:hypothetical protein Tco_1509238 [Tanacetum coccineum]
MLQICPRLLGQKFEDPPFEEEILSFIRDLGHTIEIKNLTDVNGMYHKKNVDYVYLPWEDLVHQVENKNSKKNNDMCNPRFTKVIIDYFMSKDQSIPRRNKMFWHTARDDPMFNIIRVISRHQDTQIYGAFLPVALTNQEMLDSKAYKQYYTVASGAEPLKVKTKYKKKVDEPVAPPKSKSALATKVKRLKATTKIVTKRSKSDYHGSHASGSGANEGTGVTPGVPGVPTYGSKDEHISWKSSDKDDDDEVKTMMTMMIKNPRLLVKVMMMMTMMKHDLEDEKDDEDDKNKNDSEETESDDDGDDFIHSLLVNL